MEGVGYVFVWHLGGVKPCRKCIALSGRAYREQDLFEHALVDPEFGPIWNLDGDVSLAHPNCKCHLEVHIEIDVERLQVA